jgi:hypothetical protein
MPAEVLASAFTLWTMTRSRRGTSDLIDLKERAYDAVALANIETGGIHWGSCTMAIYREKDSQWKFKKGLDVERVDGE